MPIPPNEPVTLEGFLWYCLHYKDSIFVRQQDADGNWKSFALGELLPMHQAKWISQWFDEDKIPARVREI